jgi:hypothetical protein
MTTERPSKSRVWLRAALVILFFLAVAFGVALWWRMQPAPLTVEETPYVGVWTPTVPIKPMANGAETLAYEFRPDRKIMYHRRDPKTGERYTEYMGITWRATAGQFVYVGRAPHVILGNLHTSEMDLEMNVTWDGPDRCRMATAFHGDGGPQVQELVRARE